MATRPDISGGASSFDLTGAGLTPNTLGYRGGSAAMAVQDTMSEGEKDRTAYKGADAVASRLAPGMRSTAVPFKGGKTPVKTHMRSGRKVRAHTRRGK